MADSLSHLPNYPAPLQPPFGQSEAGQNSFSKMLHNLAVNSNMSELSEPASPQGGHHRLSPGQQDMSIHGKRANRTRFSDYQVKVLQEFFEKNAYPKDDDLEYLSKLLGLTPRVIVVWFQNARQKARKAYENQPSNESMMNDDVEGRFTRTPSLSYQCKKCNLEFQRYYELIRHQKQHCYKEEDAKRSAQAQKAAAQAAAQFAGGTPPALMPISEDSNSSADHRSITSPAQEPDQRSNPEEIKNKSADLSEMTKDAVNRMFGGNQFPALSYPPNSAFGILQQQALQQQQQMQQQQQHNNHESDIEQQDNNSIASSSPSSTNKRKLSEEGDDGHDDKRLRTSILPEQLDFLGKRFADDPNPGGRALEQIAGEVGLSKKLVQLWFQNARRKGHSPPAEGALPPAGPAPPGGGDRPALPESPFAGGAGGVSEHLASLIPTTTAASGAYNLQDSMRKYYEDTMKRFMNDINAANNGNSANSAAAVEQSKNEPAAALDLTSNFDESFDQMDDSDMANKSTDGDVAHNVAGGNGSGGSNGSAGGNKRFRTQMTGVQVKMMKGIFEAYKTPTMSECSSLGQEIGLQKRVVQVWFQNARAKEKRAKLQLQQATGQQEDAMPPPEGCNVCPEFKYGHKFAVQDHLFTRAHLDNLKLAIEQGRYDPKSPGDILSHAASAIMQQQTNGGQNGQNGGQLVDSRNSSTDGGSSAASLPAAMLQMPAPTRELLEMSNHQNSRMLMQV